MKKNIFILLMSGLCLVLNVFSQEAERYLEIRGRAELDMQPLNGATATLYENNAVVKTVRTGSDGMFSFKLDVNKYYVVEVGKSNYVSKRLAFDTSLPDEESGIWVREFAISVVKNCEGVDYSPLKEPVDIIRFNNKRRDFESDKDHLSKMRNKLENIMIANENCVSDKYNQLLKEADRMLDQKSYEEAKAKYEAAAELFQNEAYPKKKLEEINQLQAEQENTDVLYNKAMGEAEALMAQNKPGEALQKYKEAASLKPQERLPKQKVNELETLIANKQAGQVAAEEAYNNAITQADNLYKAKDYQGAAEAYSRALAMKPGEIYPKQRISQIDNFIAAEEAKKQREIDAGYQQAIAAAEESASAKDYQSAMRYYQQALQFKPDDEALRRKLAETERLNALESDKRQQQEEIRKKYLASVQKADQLFASRDYDAAKSAYQDARTVKPDEQYPLQQIQEIDRLVMAEQARKQQNLMEGYQGAVNEGNALFAQKQYQVARESFNKALTFKPDDAFAKNKITEIDNLIRREQEQQAALQAKKAEYSAIIAKADALFSSRNYVLAKSEYLRALQVLPDEPYPDQRIREIDRIVTLAEAEKQRELESKYRGAMSSADTYMSRKDYDNARNSYQEALSYKPEDVLAKNKILEIDNIMRQEQARLAAIQARQKQYDDIVSRADGLFSSKSYDEARSEYQKAQQVMPDQTYPQQKIVEIERLLAEQQRLLAEQHRLRAELQAKDDAYKLSVSRADDLFNKKQYEPAKSEYRNASAIKPDEAYPKSRIAEIDNLVALRQQAEEREGNYINALREADRLFGEKEYTASRSAYNRALGIKPDEVYPKTRISEIDNLLAEADRLNQVELEKQRQYDSYISQADRLFAANNYPQAKEIYQKALGIRPEEQYPKARIARIDEIYALIAAQEKKQSDVTTTVQKPASTSKKAAPAELKFKNQGELDLYLTGLKKEYPEGVTAEVYSEKYKVTTRYIIIRGNEVKELREIHMLTYGGKQYSMNGKPITQMYFESQIKPREGEYFKKFEY
jgi:tetratricopeptide (TPR) repeat protein